MQFQFPEDFCDEVDFVQTDCVEARVYHQYSQRNYCLQTLYDSIILQESCQTLPRFCFPYDIQRWASLHGFPFACLFLSMSTSRYIPLLRVRDGVAVQHFTFVLTDLEGSQRFGFCRLTTSTHTCLCILRYVYARLQIDSHANLSYYAESHSTLPICLTQLSPVVWSVLQTSQQLGWLPQKRTGKLVSH